MRIIVYHASYGCDTGCCGHVIECDGRTQFNFSHPHGDDHLTFAQELVAEQYGEDHIKDLDWENCVISDD